MVTRRSTHANHAKPSTASKRRANRRAASESAPLYAGGKANARGGHVGNVAGFGTGSGGSSRGAAPSVGNVAGYGTGSTNVRSGGAHRRTTSPGTSHATPRATTGGNTSGPRIPTPSGGEILLTRRHFLFGALGIGALAAVGGGAAVVAQQMEKDPDADLTVLKVPASAVTSSDSLANVDDYRTRMSLTGSFELPYGTLVWANDEHVAACLLPAESAKPLTHVALLALGSGVSTTGLEGAVGLDEGFEIYDVRATSSGLVWTEADILDGIWRIYTARSAGTSIGEPVLVEEGNADYETPSIAAVGNRAFWQVLPKPKGAKKAESSLLKRATMGASDTEVVYTSRGRMATPPYASNDSVIITPRTVHSLSIDLHRCKFRQRERLVSPSRFDEAARGRVRQNRIHVLVRCRVRLRRRHLQSRNVHPNRRRNERRLQQRAVVLVRPRAVRPASMVRQVLHGEVHDRRMRS